MLYVCKTGTAHTRGVWRSQELCTYCATHNDNTTDITYGSYFFLVSKALLTSNKFSIINE